MARFRINRGQTRTTELMLNDTDRLFVLDTGAIVRSGASPAVRIANGANDVGIVNAGRIAVEGASGTAITGALGTGLSAYIRNDGTIEAVGRAIELTSAAGSTGTVRLANFGSITSGNATAIDFDGLRATSIAVFNAAGATIANSGTNDVLRPGNDAATAISVNNAGTIRAADVAGANENGDAIDLQSQAGGVAATIVNRATGLIEGGKHGVTGASAATIFNDAGGQIIGRNGSGLNFDTEAADNDGAVQIVNRGLISGRYDGLGNGDGDGIDVDFTVDLLNFGRIEGLGADNVDDFADGIAAGGGDIENRAGGVIFGAFNGILIDDGDRYGAFAATSLSNRGEITADLGTAVRLIGDFDDIIDNEGTIASNAGTAIDMGGGGDRLLNRGTIAGDVLLGAGDDGYLGIDEGTVDGLIDLGDGQDTFDGNDTAETVAAGAGRDIMKGNGGIDTFVFRATTDSVEGNADTILQYKSDDIIDLSAIDADLATGGDQAFTLIAGAVFTGVAGELIVQDTGDGQIFIYGDVDGVNGADIVIRLTGVDAVADINFTF